MGERRVTIVGAGLAGLSAALTLAEQGVPCTLASAQPSERAQSVLAEGGINAVLDLMGEHDTLEEHFADTMRGGVWLADPNAVWGLVSDAPDIVRRLAALGVPFQREHGAMVQRNFGGQRKKRTAYAKSSTGKVLVTAMVDAVRRQEAAGLVRRLPHAELAGLEVADGACEGVWLRDAFTAEQGFLPGPVLLACGGMGGLFGALTTGTTTNTGDAAALALLAGVELGNLEFVQYHPTTVPIAGKRLLVSEAARGEGGRLFALRGGERWYFMEEKYPELGNLMPRDVVSREEYAVLADPACGGQVFLDLTGLSAHVWRARLSDMRDEIHHYLGIDPTREPVPVEPGIHYCMGGILVDEQHRTNVAGLYAAGECACAYHGANRLGGNSLLGALRGGAVAARELAGAGVGGAANGDSPQLAHKVRHWGQSPSAARSQRGLSHFGERSEPKGTVPVGCPPGPREPKGTVPFGCPPALAALGILRTGPELSSALRELESLPPEPRVLLARAMVASALAREESRGAHQRADFPDTREEFRRTTVVRLEDGAPVVEFRALPEAREGVPVL